ncbi:MAG: ABC transporter permease [Rhodospirillales bacterium]|nr:ABC transporter permease [Rhodospirillales bacterium]MDE2576321.1 ABC transporter permease [Rhodospirillales bacterium]
MARLILNPLRETGSILAVVLAWYWASATHLVTDFLLPTPLSVIQRIGADAMSGDLPAALERTIGAALAGFAIAGVVGTALGIAMARVRAVRWFFDPLISIGFPMPKIAFLPIFLLWLGPTIAAEITIVAFTVLFPVATAAEAGAEGIETVMLWSARSLGAREGQMLWQIVLPAITPQLLTGLQIALPIALITAIVAEMLTGSDGVGGAMLAAMRFADSPGVFAGIIEIAVLGYGLVKMVEWLRAALLRWHSETAAW